jgi:hypothetical protein
MATLLNKLITRVSKRSEAGWKSEVRALRDAYNGLVITLAAMVPPGWVTTSPVYSRGTSDLKTWKNTAGVMSVKGVLTAITAAETAFSHTAGDQAASKEGWFVLLVAADGTTKTIVKAADQTIGTCVLPAVGANLIPLCWLKMVTGTSGFDANTDDLTPGNAIIKTLEFFPVPALSTINL